MLTFFRRANGPGLVDVKIKTATVGSGESGAKCRFYREFAPVVDATRCAIDDNELAMFHSLPNTNMTPAFLKEFLNRSGASHENLYDAQQAINETEFNVHEKEGIRTLLEPFESIYVSLRADERSDKAAAGVGLWYTGFMIGGTSEAHLTKAGNIIKAILQTDYDLDVVAFKKRVGMELSSTPGVFVTPFAGDEIGDLGVFTNLYHANMMTHFSGDKTMINYGNGIGGGNGDHAKAGYLNNAKRSIDLDAETIGSPWGLYKNNFIPLKLIEAGEAKASHNQMKAKVQSIAYDKTGYSERFSGIFYQSIESFKRQVPTATYLEAAYMEPIWAFIQGAPISFPQVQKPDIPKSQLILGYSADGSFNNNLAGRGVVQSEDMVIVPYGDRDEIDKLRKLNKELKNYVLVINFFVNAIFAIPFDAYSNAAAVVFTEKPRYSFATHFNGILRATGILAMAGLNEKHIDGLPNGVAIKKKTLVYVDDSIGEGFMAALD